MSRVGGRRGPSVCVSRVARLSAPREGAPRGLSRILGRDDVRVCYSVVAGWRQPRPEDWCRVWDLGPRRGREGGAAGTRQHDGIGEPLWPAQDADGTYWIGWVSPVFPAPGSEGEDAAGASSGGRRPWRRWVRRRPTVRSSRHWRGVRGGAPHSDCGDTYVAGRDGLSAATSAATSTGPARPSAFSSGAFRDGQTAEMGPRDSGAGWGRSGGSQDGGRLQHEDEGGKMSLMRSRLGALVHQPGDVPPGALRPQEYVWMERGLGDSSRGVRWT